MRSWSSRQWALGLVAVLLAALGSGTVSVDHPSAATKIVTGLGAGIADVSATLADSVLPGGGRFDSATTSERAGSKARAQGWALPVAVAAAMALAAATVVGGQPGGPPFTLARTFARRRAPPSTPIP